MAAPKPGWPQFAASLHTRGIDRGRDDDDEMPRHATLHERADQGCTVASGRTFGYQRQRKKGEKWVILRMPCEHLSPALLPLQGRVNQNIT